MHAFDGKASYAQKAANAYGWLFSIPPSVVRSSQKQKLVRLLPLESLALESDSPVLGPERNQRNEPANLTFSIECIAGIKKTPKEDIITQTTENARRLFGLPSSEHFGNGSNGWQ
jgi:TatD DNase family protein